QYLEALREAIKPNLDRLCGDCHHRYETNPLRVFDCKTESCQPVIAGLPTITDWLDNASREDFDRFEGHRKDRNIHYTITQRIVRCFFFKQKTAYEIIGHDGLGAQNAIVGGGRYDGLSETLGGPPVKGFGFAFGLDRIVMSLPEEEAEKIR